jgi:hypothetical protein
LYLIVGQEEISEVSRVRQSHLKFREHVPLNLKRRPLGIHMAQEDLFVEVRNLHLILGGF